MNAFVDPLVKLACSNSPSAKEAREILSGEYLVTPEAMDSKISSRLVAWVDMYKRQGQQDKADVVDGMRIGYDSSDIPF